MNYHWTDSGFQKTKRLSTSHLLEILLYLTYFLMKQGFARAKGAPCMKRIHWKFQQIGWKKKEQLEVFIVILLHGPRIKNFFHFTLIYFLQFCNFTSLKFLLELFQKSLFLLSRLKSPQIIYLAVMLQIAYISFALIYTWNL